jgi:hypothetical protein
MMKQWPAPSNWQDFEELCEAIYYAEHKPLQSFRYGRAGQAQFGVDIVARSSVNGLWTGIQCKLKTELVKSKLTEQQLIDAYNTSKKFQWSMEKLIVATTCATDRAVQDLAINITDSHQRKYPIEVLWWDQIQTLLDQHTDVAKRFYPECFPVDASLVETPDGTLYLSLVPENGAKALEQLFDNKIYKAETGKHAKTLAAIVSELVDNAFNPGKGGATRIYVALSEGVLTVRDNGKAFDPVSSSITLTSNMKGIKGIRRCFENSNGDLKHQYFAADYAKTRFNHNRIDIVSSADMRLASCRVSAPGLFLLNRQAAFRFVDELHIPEHCDPFTLRLLGDETGNFSSISQLVSSLLSRLNGRALRIKISEDCQEEIVETLYEAAIEFPKLIVEVI